MRFGESKECMRNKINRAMRSFNVTLNIPVCSAVILTAHWGSRPFELDWQ